MEALSDTSSQIIIHDIYESFIDFYWNIFVDAYGRIKLCYIHIKLGIS